MINEYSVIYSPAALNDLRSIYAYIAFELMASQAAENTVNRIRSGIRSLSQFPEKHRTVDWEPWHSMDMRVMPVQNYAAYYLIDHDAFTVTIIRVFYSGRDVEHIINKE